MPAPIFWGPVPWHGARDPVHCGASLSPEDCAWYANPWRSWYMSDLTFARGMNWFFLATVAFFAVLHGTTLLRQKKSCQKGLALSSVLVRPTAIWRLLTGQPLRLFGYALPTSGVVALGAAFFLFWILMTLVPQPYYWPNNEDMKFGMSPPLATRAGWISLGMLPFQVVLAAKWSFITMLTGVSHERLNVLHRWTGWVMWVAGLIHTFPFIISYTDMGVMKEEWNTYGMYWTGVAALVPQTVMLVWGIRPLRNAYYELFKKAHYILAILYVVFLALHCQGMLTCWDYFLALGVIYLISLSVRWIRAFFVNGFRTADISLIDQDILRISIPTGDSLRWKAGQHYLFRFYAGGLTQFQSHPFTVCSIPSDGQIELFVRIHRGISARLASLASSKGWAGRTLLDGPYGGPTFEVASCQNVLLLAGGTGVGFTLSVLRQLKSTPGAVTSITFVFATRSPGLMRYVQEAVSKLKTSNVNQTIHLHLTTDTEAPATLVEQESPSVLEEKKSLSNSSLTTVMGRPDLRALVHAAATEAGAQALGIISCGHDEFTHDVRSAATAAQKAIATGKIACREIQLHAEVYSW